MEPLAPSDPDRIASYELLGRLGAGGMGLVYKARSPGGRLVAVKVIHTQYTDDPRFLRRFRREVEAARSVSGFYTAPVVDADTESRPAWLATAHVAGPSLGAAVQSRGPLPGREVTALAAALAEALKAVHAAGLVHRDLKPSNILLAEDGPRVIDFGIVQAVDGTATTGGLIGTPEYMAPEQIDADGEIGPASDVFALGGVLYCAATGRPPFGTGDARAVLYRVQTAEPDLGRVPVELRDLIGRCLAKEPSLRPTPDEILAELAGSVADGPVDWTGGPQDTRTDEPTAGTDEGTTGAAPHSDPEPGPEPERAPEPRPATAPVRPPRPEPPPERPPETLSRTSAALRRRGWALLAATALVGTVAFVVLDLGGSGGGGGFRPWSVADAQGAAVIADGLAYIGMKDGTAAHDARTGQRRWKSVSGEPEAVATRYGGVLLVRSETRLSALDPRSGNRLWQFPLEDDGCVTRSSPKGNFVVIGKSHWQRGTRISGVEAATGARAWSRTLGSVFCGNGVTATENGVVVAATDQDEDKDEDKSTLVYLAAESGEGWRVPSEKIRAVASEESNVYTAANTEDGLRIRAHAADTGRRRWDATLPNPDGTRRFGDLHLVAEGSQVYALVGGTLYAFRSSDGRQLWKLPLYQRSSGDLYVADGTAYVSWNDSYTRFIVSTVRRTSLAAIDTATGRRLWHKRIEALCSFAAAEGRTVYVDYYRERTLRPNEESLIAFDARTGRQRWERGIDVGGAVTIDSGILYVPTRDDELEAIDAATGHGP